MQYSRTTRTDVPSVAMLIRASLKLMVGPSGKYLLILHALNIDIGCSRSCRKPFQGAEADESDNHQEETKERDKGPGKERDEGNDQESDRKDDENDLETISPASYVIIYL
jgi:hypothetical protein